MTRDQLGACIMLEASGLQSVGMPMGDGTPIPGLILMANVGHTKLLMIQGDGTAVDLLEVFRAAEDCMRNWHQGDKLPGFVGDFRRLTAIAHAVNGKKIEPPPNLPMVANIPPPPGGGTQP